MVLFSRRKEQKLTRNEATPDGFRAARTADHLISQAVISPYIQRIQSLVALPNQYFSLFYLEPLKKFISMTQPCDEAVVTQRLADVVKGLRLRKAYLLPKGVDPESIRGKKDLWTYATFVALLMYNLIDLVKPVVYQTDEASGRDGYSWHPAINSALQPPYLFKPADGPDFAPMVTPLLLPHIFDEHCLDWLSRDSEAFNNSIESMVTPQANSSIGPIVRTIYQLNDESPPLAQTAVSKPEIMPLPVESEQKQKEEQATARNLGRQFMTWLITQLSDASLPGHSCIHQLPEGTALVSPDIFKYYADTHGCDWKAVQNGFIKLKLHQSDLETHAHIHSRTLADGTLANVLILPSLTV